MKRVVVIAALVLGVSAMSSSLMLDHASGSMHALPFVPFCVAFAVVGAVVLLRGGNTMLGGLLLFAGVAPTIGLLAGSYADFALDRALPGAAWAAWVFQMSIGLSAPVFLLFQLFPDGRPLTRSWRALVWATLATTAVAVVLPGISDCCMFGHNFPTITHPLPLVASPVSEPVFTVTQFAVVAVFVASAVSLAFRYRRSEGDERLQLKWLAGAAAVAAGGFALAALLPLGIEPVTPFALLMPLIPVACGIAILKYHLYEIDVVIKKALVFGVLAAFITLVYVGIVVVLGGSARATTESPVTSIAATAVVALLFQPVRERVQRFANRLVYGKRATPYEVMAGFSSRVSGTVSTDQVLPEMAEAAGSGVGALSASVRVFLPDGGERVERWARDGAPSPDSESRSIDVRYQGGAIGRLSVTKAPTEPLTPAEEKLLDDLAAQAGLALHNVRLTDELGIRVKELDEQAATLRVSRERLVTARDAQRRGLERDIREGPQRFLIDIRHRIDDVTAVARRNAEEARRLADGLSEQANTTLEALRDLARGIFPPLLADKGVVPALEAHVRKVGANATIEATPSFSGRRFRADIEACIYFCCLQAIQNVIRHASNASSTVRIDVDATAIAFSVTDEGRGFDAAASPPGMGLQIVQDRVQALEGDLRVTSEPGHGTTIAVRLPLAAEVPA